MEVGEGWVSAQILRGVLGYASARHGLDWEGLLVRFGLRGEALTDPDATIDVKLMVRVWDELSALCGDPDFGLHLAEAAPPGALSLAGYLCISAPTVGEGWRQALRYEALIQDAATTRVIDTPEALTLVHQAKFAEVPYPRHAVEFGFAAGIIQSRRASGHRLVPSVVQFVHPRPDDCSEHLRIFGMLPTFGAADNRVSYPASVGRLPQHTADAALHAMFDGQARSLLERMSPDNDFLTHARLRVNALLREGECSLERLAARMSVTPRTLQRRLSQAGTSLHALQEETRKALALQYLEDAAMPLHEVAFALGFSEQSAFHRAFVRWTGAAPGHWRRQRVATSQSPR